MSSRSRAKNTRVNVPPAESPSRMCRPGGNSLINAAPRKRRPSIRRYSSHINDMTGRLWADTECLSPPCKPVLTEPGPLPDRQFLLAQCKTVLAVREYVHFETPTFLP